jgi:hypothetical protein
LQFAGHPGPLDLLDFGSLLRREPLQPVQRLALLAGTGGDGVTKA